MPRIQVIVNIGEDLKIDVLGQLIAVGTADKRITITSFNNTIYWKHIYIKYSNKVSQLKFCDIINANQALHLYIEGVNDTMKTQIIGCKFINCKTAAIYGESKGAYDGYWYVAYEPDVAPTIKSCFFDACSSGCIFYTDGVAFKGPWSPWQYGRGSASPEIKNSIFLDIIDTAFLLDAGDFPKSSKPIFQNNTLVNSKRGIFTEEPFDLIIKNNIFYKNKIDIERTGNLSSLVGFNCFFEKDSNNFIGCPQNFGKIITKNRKGTPCDLAINIFEDPIFADSILFNLKEISPCIDVGDPNLEHDPDGTSADIGAQYFHQPSVKVDEYLNLPKTVLLFENYPNPFNSETIISYQLSVSIDVRLTIYNIMGQLIRTLVNEYQEDSYQTVRWDGRDNSRNEVTSGVYIYQLRAGNHLLSKKILLMR